MNTNQIRSKIAEIQAEAKGYNGRQEYSEADLSRIVALGDELKGLEAQLATTEKAERVLSEAKGFAEREAAVRPLDVAPAAKAERKSVAVQFAESPAAKVKGVEATLDVEVKTLMTTTAGVPVASRGNAGVVVYQPTPATTLLDRLEVIPANPGTGYRFYAEVLYTNNAAAIPEGGLYPESELKLVEQVATIAKVGTFIPATDEQLSDIPGAPDYIDSRIRTMVKSRAATEAMSGAGGANKVQGVLNTPGTLTRARGADTVLDALFKAMMQVADAGSKTEDAQSAAIDLFVMNPTDWATLRLAKDSTGRYLLGDPAAAGEFEVWGVPVVLDKGLPLGTVLGLDTSFFKILLGADVTVQQTNSNGTDFIHGINCIRAQVRLGVVALRASAAITVTGLNA